MKVVVQSYIPIGANINVALFFFNSALLTVKVYVVVDFLRIPLITNDVE